MKYSAIPLIVIILLMGMKPSDTKTVYVKEKCKCEMVAKYYLKGKLIHSEDFSEGMRESGAIQYARFHGGKEKQYDSVQYSVNKKYPKNK
jgi:hypothetical protein